MKSRVTIPKIATLDNVVLELGEIVSVRNLAIAPIYGYDTTSNDAILVDEAIKTGNFSVTQSRKVKYLKIMNKLPSDVFIAEGQVIEGDSQNRMAIYSTLVPAHSDELALPVRCVQHGQGLLNSSRYSASNTFMMPSLRGNEPDKTWTTAASPSGLYTPAPVTDQEKTWTAITHVTRVFNRTRIFSAADIRKENFSDVLAHAKLEDYLGELNTVAQPEQVGYVAIVGRSDGGFDLYTDFFGNHEHLNGLYERLLSSVAFVAKLHNQDSIYKKRRELALTNVDHKCFSPFLERIAQAEVDRISKVGESQYLTEPIPPARSTVGKGDLYRLQKAVDGSVLVEGEKYIQTFAKAVLN